MIETYTSRSQWLERDINKARQQSTLRSAITTTSAKKKVFVDENKENN